MARFWPLTPDGRFELTVFAVDPGDVANDLGDAHHRDIFGAHNAAQAGGFHAGAAQAKEGCGGQNAGEAL